MKKAFVVKDPDFELSPYTGMSKKHIYINGQIPVRGGF